MDFQFAYDLLCRNLRRFQEDEDFSYGMYEAYRVGVLDTIKALGLWGEYCKWAEENDIPDDPETDDEEDWVCTRLE